MKSFYQDKEYKDFLENLSSYEQQKKFIEIIRKAIFYGIDSYSANLMKYKGANDVKKIIE